MPILKLTIVYLRVFLLALEILRQVLVAQLDAEGPQDADLVVAGEAVLAVQLAAEVGTLGGVKLYPYYNDGKGNVIIGK